MKKLYYAIGSSSYGWTGIPLDSFSEMMTSAGNKVAALKKELGFDAVAFSGSSGAALAFHLAIAHKIPIIYVRKEDEQSHGYPVECNFGNTTQHHIKKYLIVDDFVGSGNTIRRIVRAISNITKERGAYPAKPIGIFCYDRFNSKTQMTYDKTKVLKIYA